MYDFGADVGIEFNLTASGYAASGISDPETAERVGRVRGTPLQFSQRLAIPRLAEFLDSAAHVAEIAGGAVEWKPDVDGAAVLPGGQVTFFRTADASGKHKFIEYNFSFAAAGRVFTCRGAKDLESDNGLDAASDLSTIRLTLEADGHLAGSGVAHENLLDFVRQVQSCRVTGARSESESDAARAAFLGFFNGELREVYPELPLLFPNTAHFSPEQKRALELCARLLLPAKLPAGGPQIGDVTEALDRFLANASASLLSTITNWLQVIGTFLPEGADPKLLRLLVTAALNDTSRSPIRDVLGLLHTLVVFPYYSHAKADAVLGYQRPVHHPRNTPDLPVVEEPPDRVYDFAIAGSGPAGTLLAQRLSAKGKSVVLLESGPYIPERTMDADEVMGTARLYKSSGLQQANATPSLAGAGGPAFTVLQGACLGGGGVVNNAVCFRLPAKRLSDWQSIGFPVSAADMAAAYTQVAQDLGIRPVSDAATPSPRLNPTWKFLAGKLGPVRKPPLGDPPSPGLYECLVNIEDCLGTGLCNVGCGSERKRNGVQVYLRQASAAGCVIVEHAEVQALRVDAGSPAGGRRVRSMEVRLRGGRRISVKAKQFLLACGPVGSTAVLLKSEDLSDPIRTGRIPVGRRFSANLGSPVFAFCREAVNQQPGLQIAHYYFAPAGEGFVIETWFNPPGANAIAMPGFQQTHFDRMMAYARTVAAAPLVGSEASGRVSLDWLGEPKIELPITGAEIGRLRRGLVLLAGAFLDGNVESALVALGNGRQLKTEADLEQLDRDLGEIERDPSKAYLLKVGTGHPQGGNAMSADPEIGAIDAEFRLRGFSNLRICDGSIFPESAGVNPQWTIMALAHVCARIAAEG